jgi:16S rRNA (uracil1498-N3)-methyltransferase
VARLFVPPARLQGDRVTLTGEEHRRVCRVLRLRAGDRITLFDGAGNECEAVLEEPGSRSVAAVIVGRRTVSAPSGPAVTLLVGLTKGERMDLVVQKATELGVAGLVPVETTRVVPRLEAERARGRRARWLTIAREAARQCGRADAPTVAEITPFAAALRQAPAEALKLIFWEEAAGVPLRTCLPAAAPAKVVLAVGPEGGFAPEEIAAAEAAGFRIASLGPRTLRAETAAIVAVALVEYAVAGLPPGEPSGPENLQDRR